MCSKRLWLCHPENNLLRWSGTSCALIPRVCANLEVGSRAGLSAGDALDAVPMATEAASTGLAPTASQHHQGRFPCSCLRQCLQELLEYRRRCEVYKQKMEMAGRGKETIFNPVILMTGRSWDCGRLGCRTTSQWWIQEGVWKTGQRVSVWPIDWATWGFWEVFYIPWIA